MRYRRALLVLGVGAGAGCSQQDAPTSVESPEVAYSAGGAGDFSADVSPAVSDENVGPLPLGEYPHPTLAKIKVTGLISQFFSDAAVWNPPGGPDRRGEFRSLWDAAGLWNGTTSACHGYVRVEFSVSGGKAFCDFLNAKPLTSEWVDTVVNRGTATVTWVKGPVSGNSQCDGVGQTECFTYSGSHSLTVKALPAELALTADRYVVYPGKASVKFTPAPFPKKFGSKFTPMQVQSWQWTPDSAGAVATPCGTAATCTYTPPGSGTMRVQAVVNGVVKTKDVHIRKLCAPTGDPLLDSLPILDALRAAEAASGDPNVAGNQLSRREHHTSVQSGPDGGWTSTLSDLGSPCGGTPPRVDTIPGIKADGHTHPFNPAVKNTPPAPGWTVRNTGADTIPDACKKNPNGATSGSAPWPSPEDWQRVESLNNGPAGINLPHYILDPDNIYAIPGGDMPMADRIANTRTIPRQQGSCRII